MKEAMGGVSLFQIFFAFILLFTGIMCLTINHSRAYGVKDEIINIIERESGNKKFNEVVALISEHIQESGHLITGNCSLRGDNFIGYDRNGNITNGSSAAFCLKENNVASAFTKDANTVCAKKGCKVTESMYPDMKYYDVVIFYQLDIPLLSQALNLTLNGSTKVIVG